MSKNSCEAAEKCRRHVLRMHMGAAELFAAVHGARLNFFLPQTRMGARLNFFAADAHGGAAELFCRGTWSAAPNTLFTVQWLFVII